MTITNWPKNERPREKLLEHGPQNLSDAELLAIFIRTGTKGKTAVDIARELLNKNNGIKNLLDLNQNQMCQHSGLGQAKYAQLQAALELSRRYLYANLKKTNIIINPNAAYKYLVSKLRNHKKEVFACIFLDNQNHVISYKELFYGSINNATVYPREIVKQALEYNAAAIIIAHNHIAGGPEPSPADKHLTKQLIKILEIIDIRMLDHIIVGENNFISFSKEGYINKFFA